MLDSSAFMSEKKGLVGAPGLIVCSGLAILGDYKICSLKIYSMSEEAEGIGNEGFLIDADSALNENNEIEIRLFVRIGNKIETFYDAGLRPYFYAIVNGNIEEARKKLLGESFGEAQAKILNAENVKKENVENVLKLEFKNTNDLTAARE